MNVNRGGMTLLTAGMIAAATVLLAGCSAPAPAPPKPAHSATHAPHAAAVQAFTVPAPQRGDLVRIVYSRGGAVNGASVEVPSGQHGYNIDFGCSADDPTRTVGFELMHGSTWIVSGSGHCDATQNSDTALPPGYPAESVHLVMTGDMSKISAAYLILTPSRQG